jgi:hypothetical protein
MCYGYQASGCSYGSEEQNCFQLVDVFNEKADSLGLVDLVMPGSQLPEGDCLLIPSCIPESGISYDIYPPEGSSIRGVFCNLVIDNATDCAGLLYSRCQIRGSDDSLLLIQSQVDIHQEECEL